MEVTEEEKKLMCALNPAELITEVVSLRVEVTRMNMLLMHIINGDNSIEKLNKESYEALNHKAVDSAFKYLENNYEMTFAKK